MDSGDDREGRAMPWPTVAAHISVVSGILVLVLSALIVVNYIQIHTVDPLNSPALAEMMQQLRSEPENEALKQQVRALDLLARRAYFTHQWQLRAGSYLLFASVIVLLVSLRYLHSLRQDLPDLEQEPPEVWPARILARRGLVAAGAVVFGSAAVLAVLTEVHWASRPAVARGAGGAYPSLEEIRAQWPCFRGPEGIGVAHHTVAPALWDGASGQGVMWKVPVPKPGFSSPIVWGDRLFLSGADSDVQEVYCYSAETGDLLWQGHANDIAGSPDERPDVTDDTGYAAPTMATDGHRVFAVFATGDLACWEFGGSRLWGRNLGLPENPYGHSSSLIVFEDLVLVQFDDNQGGRLLAVNTPDGNLVYDTDRDVQISWASPILVETGKRTELILNSNPSVVSHDPRTGRELWRVECMMGEVAPSPAYADGLVFVVNEYARLAAIRVGAAAEMAWEFDDYLAEVASPVATSEFLVVATSYGTVACFDSKTGEELWFHDFDEGFYASPILVGDLVYLVDRSGLTHILKLGREFEQTGRCALGEGVVATPAVMPQRIYIRGLEHLYCIGE